MSCWNIWGGEFKVRFTDCRKTRSVDVWTCPSVSVTLVLVLCGFVLLSCSSEEPEQVDNRPTAMTLPSQSNVNVHNIKTLKLLEYTWVTDQSGMSARTHTNAMSLKLNICPYGDKFHKRVRGNFEDPCLISYYSRIRIRVRLESAWGWLDVMWTFTSLLHTVSFVCVFVLSGKQADVVPDEVFDAAAGQSVVTVNFSKNQLTSVPPRYCTHTHSHTHRV